MRLILNIVVVAMMCVPTLAMAQSVGTNINVLPLVLPQDDPANWYLTGDGYLQRQVEPTIAVSTRNPDHVITFFNDYRAIDVEIDEAPPDPFPVIIAALKLNPTTTMWAGLLEEVWPLMQPPMAATAEAWVGMSRSYDGGLTWLGGMLPGGPFDDTTPSELSPVYGRQAATDPVAGAAPCGYVYVVFVAFTRGDESSLAVARYRDLNNDESGDTWVYDGTWLIETGNNATHGYFLDKPFLAIDHDRTGADACGSAIYVSYTTFNGFDHYGNFQSKVHVATSTDNAETWDKIKVNKTYGQGQGTAISIDPRPGVPSDPNGGGTVYVAFRHFFDPDAILVTKSTDFAKRFSAPVEITEGISFSPFDQPTIANSIANPTNETAFRSNAFPTLAVAGNGNVFAAWQEHVNITSNNSNVLGRPEPGGSPRIVVTQSTDGGDTWSARSAVDFDDRDGEEVGEDCVFFSSTPEPGYGALPQCRPSGPQVKPRLVFGGGQLLLGYTESRGLLGTDLNGNEVLNEADLSGTGFASGYHRAFDFRAALLDPMDGHRLSTTQVSRYPISFFANLGDGEDVADIAPINPPCSPDYGEGYSPCVRQLNLKNRPQSGAGTAPFMGDYPDATSILPFVPDGYGGWRWATEPADMPYRGFRVVFPDNRHLVPPTYPDTIPEIDRYPYYDEPGTGQPSCTNTGSRNTDVLTARVDTDLVLSTPTSYKQLNAVRSFPFTVSNRTDQTRYYRLTISDPEGLATFSPKTGVYIDQGDIEVFRYSSVAQVIYVDPGSNSDRSIRVDVVEINEYGAVVSGGQSGSVVFNADPENPDVGTPQQEVQNPFAENPFYENPFFENPFYENPFYENPFYENPFYENSALADETIYDIVDTTWTVTADGSNTAASYFALVNIDNAAKFVDNYSFQLIIYKNSGYTSADSCDAFAQPEPQVLSNVVNDPENPFYENPFYENPFYENPFYENPFYENPFYENSTFALAPSDAATQTLKNAPAGDGTLKAERGPDQVHILLRAFQVQPDAVIEATGGFFYKPDPEEGGDSPALTVIYRGCNTRDPDATCYFTTAPDLVPNLRIADSTPQDPIYLPTDYEVTAPAGGTLTGFPAGGWDLYNQKLANQTFGDAIAENGFLQHGFHICGTDYIENPPAPLDWDKKPLDLSECEPITQTLPNVDCETNPIPQCTILELGESDWFAPIDLSIPMMDPGDYYIVLYADQDVQVSERIEVNNWVAVPITITNPPPTASAQSFDVNEDALLANGELDPDGVVRADVYLDAEDPNGDDLIYSISSLPTYGSLILIDSGTGEFSYDPNENFNGTDTFQYLANDGTSDSNIATVTITVLPVNDTPTIGGGNDFNVPENGSLNDQLDASDIEDPDALTFSNTTEPAHGALTLNPDGTFTYTPDQDYLGGDSFDFQVTDTGGATASGTANITVYDPVPNWLFIGFNKPWKPYYRINAGSAVPLKWHYADPGSGQKVPSFADPLPITAVGYESCDADGDPVGDPIATLNLPEDAGSSDLRYNDGDWQLNWDTVGLEEGCYFLSIYHPYTNQLDGQNAAGEPLTIVLR